MKQKKGTIMELRNVNNNALIATYDNEKKTITIQDTFLKRALEIDGITIPELLKEQYGNKTTVKLNDPEFTKAFKDVYYVKHYKDKENYKWFQ